MTLKKTSLYIVILSLAGVAILQVTRPASGGVIENLIQAPEFTHTQADDWLNSSPLSLADLRGNVVLVDFWAFECWNCYRSFPWLNGMQHRLESQGLKIVGVHSLEFEREKNKKNVATKMKEFKLDHPVMIDNDFSYWRALGNRYWPAYYIIDKKGDIRAVFYGETHDGDERAVNIEKTIKALLAEPD